MKSTTLRDRALTVGAVLGSLCLVAAIACAVLDVRPLVFRSGSMSPTIDTGALAFAKKVPAADLSKGDVVSVTASSGERVTHRIVSVGTSQDGARPLQLKGDANQNPDEELYRVDAADRVLFDVPLVGYAISFLRSGAGLFLLGLLAAGLALVIVRPGGSGGESSSPRGGSRRKPGGRRKAARLAVPALAGAVTLAVAAPAMATFTDTGKVTSGTVQTATLEAPTNLTCSALGLGRVRFNWTGTLKAASYTLTFSNGAAPLTVSNSSTSATITTFTGSATVTVSANQSFGSPVTTTWTSPASNSVTYSSFVVTTCS